MSAQANLQGRRHAIYGWLLLSPAALLLTFFAFYPSVATLWSSLFSRGTRRKPAEFIGSENYTELFSDPTFWIVVKNNLIYAGVTIPVSIFIALSMALWANSKISARGFVRTAYFTPTVLPMIAAAYHKKAGGKGELKDYLRNLWGDRFYNPETKKWASKRISGGGTTRIRGFCKAGNFYFYFLITIRALVYYSLSLKGGFSNIFLFHVFYVKIMCSIYP